MAAPACCGRRRTSCCSTTSSARPISPSGVRLNATARYLGVLVGPGGRRALSCSRSGRRTASCSTRCSTCRLVLWLVNAPYGPRFRKGTRRRRGVPCAASPTSCRPCATSRAHPIIVSMVLLAGCASFFVGNAYNAQMPSFAERSRPRRSRPRLQHAAGGGRRRRPDRRRGAGRRRLAQGRAAHRHCAGAVVVLRADRVCAARTAIRWRWRCCSSPVFSSFRSTRWRRRLVQLNAPPTSAAASRPVQHGEPGLARPSAASPSACSAA